MTFVKCILILTGTFVGLNSLAQTPNNCANYTSTGTTASGTTANDCAVPGMVPGNSSAAWTGTSCGGFITSTVVGGPVSCLTLAYIAVNQNDYGTITTNTGGTLTITAINAAVNGNVVGPYSCGASFVGTVAITVCSDIPFNSVTLTNSGCSSGWVINCASQTGCTGMGNGNAGADSLTTVCGGTIDLDNLITGDIGGTWTETTSSGQFNTGSAVLDAGAAGPGSYNFQYIVAGGCAGDDTAYFTVNVVTPATASWNLPAGTVCQNDPDIDLNTLVTGTPGGVWSGTGVAGNSFDPSFGTQSITYSVGTPPCNDISTQSITVTTAPDPTWNSPGTICASAGPINLDALITGDTGGSWTGTGVSGSTFDPTGLSGPITVTYTIGSAPCIGVDQQTITVEPDVNPSWLPPATLCTDSPIFDLTTSITGTSGGTWSGTGVTGSNFDPSSGTQSITYSVGNGVCIETSVQSIVVGLTPSPAWSALTMCASDAPVNLNAQITGTTGGTWSGTGITGTVFDPFFGTQPITYTVTTGNCSAQSTQNVTVLDPVITLIPTHISCFGLSDGSINATLAGASGNESYLWNPSGQTSATANNLAAGTYQLTVTDGSCISSDSITIVEPPEIILNLSGTQGCSPSLGAAAVSPYGGVGGFTYVWTPSGQNTPSAIQLDSAMHVITVTDANGCSAQDSVLIQILPPPNIATINDTTIIYPNCIQLATSGGVSYEWTPDTDMDCDTCWAPTVCPMWPTQYCVTGVDAYGCKNDDCVMINVDIICGDIFVPSGFSPNADGENDVLCVYSDCMEQMTFTIYNRWGEKVFQSSNMGICWDGTWNGKILNAGVFVYTLDGYLINGQLIEQKGNISLIR